MLKLCKNCMFFSFQVTQNFFSVYRLMCTLHVLVLSLAGMSTLTIRMSYRCASLSGISRPRYDLPLSLIHTTYTALRSLTAAISIGYTAGVKLPKKNKQATKWTERIRVNVSLEETKSFIKLMGFVCRTY